jgi:hypothetical protein
VTVPLALAQKVGLWYKSTGYYQIDYLSNICPDISNTIEEDTNIT